MTWVIVGLIVISIDVLAKVARRRLERNTAARQKRLCAVCGVPRWQHRRPINAVSCEIDLNQMFHLVDREPIS